MKRMMHPQHGFHNAVDVHEEERLRATGWVDDDPTSKAYPQPIQEPEPSQEQRQKRPYNRKTA
jgi:hypothetical protein